jgi:hypothetical protein
MRLTKRQAEELLSGLDECPVAALTVALRIVLDRPHTDWPGLVEDLPDGAALAAGDLEACDRLAKRLNELRSI